MKRFITILSVLLICDMGIKTTVAETRAPLPVESGYMDYVKSVDKKTSGQSVQTTKKSTPKKEPSGAKKEITMSALDAVKLAGALIDRGDMEQAQQILVMMPQTKNLPVEIERWYLLAQIEQHKGNIDEAIKIYRKILDDQPDLVKIRYELALCYMAKHQWYRADYHLRLAMAGADIPPRVKQAMMYYRWIARQNKRWNAWFNFGAAPDNNVNQASGGEETIINEWGEFTRVLPEPAPASSKSGPSVVMTACFCIGFSLFNISSVIFLLRSY